MDQQSSSKFGGRNALNAVKSLIRRMLVQLEMLNVTGVIAEVIIVHNVYLRW